MVESRSSTWNNLIEIFENSYCRKYCCTQFLEGKPGKLFSPSCDPFWDRHGSSRSSSHGWSDHPLLLSVLNIVCVDVACFLESILNIFIVLWWLMGCKISYAASKYCYAHCRRPWHSPFQSPCRALGPQVWKLWEALAQLLQHVNRWAGGVGPVGPEMFGTGVVQSWFLYVL